MVWMIVALSVVWAVVLCVCAIVGELEQGEEWEDWEDEY